MLAPTISITMITLLKKKQTFDQSAGLRTKNNQKLETVSKKRDLINQNNPAASRNSANSDK